MESLSKFFPTLTKDAFGKRGFAQADVLSHWAAIAGEELAKLCAPERIKWPRDGGAGTLVLRAAAGRALDVEYQSLTIKDRINQFFGYQAIAAVKVVAGIAAGKHGQKAPPPADPAALFQRLSGFEDDALKMALARLGVAVETRSPQAK